MNNRPECIPCCLRRLLHTADRKTADDWLHRKILAEVMQDLTRVDEMATPAELMHGVARRTGKALGVSDPYAEEKKRWIDETTSNAAWIRSVVDEGEYSILLFGGEFSHAIVKRPKAGDYRVQPHLGGTEVTCEPPAGAIELAQAALAAAPAEAAYARVDMVRDNDGRLAIIELELIEPSLWLQHAPDGGELFVRAIREALG